MTNEIPQLLPEDRELILEGLNKMLEADLDTETLSEALELYDILSKGSRLIQ